MADDNNRFVPPGANLFPLAAAIAGQGNISSATNSTNRGNFIPRSCMDRQCLTWQRVTVHADSVIPPPRSGGEHDTPMEVGVWQY